MKIVLYGVPLAGKSRLVERLLDSSSFADGDILHVELAKALLDFAKQNYHASFATLGQGERLKIYDTFMETLTKRASTYKHVIVDAHYGILQQDGFYPLSTVEQQEFYDAFFYLDAPSQKIVQNFSIANKSKELSKITPEEIARWKDLEIDSLRDICRMRDKDLFVLRGNTHENTSFLKDYLDINRDFAMDSQRIAEELYGELQEQLSGHSTVVVLDCDKTIGPQDGSVAYIEALGLDPERFKRVFGGHRYSMCQFYNLAMQFTGISADEHHRAVNLSSSRLNLYAPLVQDIRNSLPEAFYIGLTAGVLPVWATVAQREGFPDVVLGCKNYATKHHLISTDVKRHLVRILRDSGRMVYAFGDSLIDFPMLEEASKGYLVAYGQLNPAVATFLKKGRPTAVKQLAYYDLHYPELPVVANISAI